ncbi:MarR family transcriptional regulator [Ferrimonas pelagia]|uniref:HTH marR-type domain-containing protein n=1 Tax=Ferrimonas pelagia TaxID=1177826 RepID=A0ABP9FBY6_9GAMM
MKIDQSLMALERYISRRWREVPETACTSLSYTEYDYLETLEEAGSVRLSDLAKRMLVSKPTASNMVARLQRKGLVERQPCQEDGRAFLLSISVQAKALLAQDRTIYGDLISELVDEMSPQDRQHLAQLLTRMVAKANRSR